MKCPKCSYENPSGVRYCLKCGSQMVPPLPVQKRPRRKTASKAGMLIALSVALIAAFSVGIGFLILGLVAHDEISQNETAVAEAPMDSVEEAELIPENPKTAYLDQFVNFDAKTLSIPDSSLKIQFPDYDTYTFDYDPSRQLLIFALETPDNLSVTYTSSKLNAAPYTKSEAEASSKTGLYHSIAGEEDEYYYILPANGPTANATIVDCVNNRSTTITVYDKDWKLEEHESAPVSEESSEAAESMEDVLAAGESSVSMEEVEPDSGSKAAPNETEKKSQVGSEIALSTLEELLDSLGYKAVG